MMADSIVLNEVFSENNLKNDELQTINTNADPIEPNEAFPENNLNLDEPLTKTTDNLVELNKVLSESNLIVDESQTISTKNDSVELNGVSSESILNNGEPQENTTNKSQELDEVFSKNNLKSDELQTLNTTTDPIELNEVFPEKNLNLDEPLTKTTDNLVELNKVFSKSNLIVDESQTISSKDDSVELNGVSSESILNNDDPQKNTTNNSLELDEVLSKSNLNIDKPQTISSKDDSVELNEVFPKSDLNDDEPQTINETDNPEALNKLFPKSNLNVTEQQIATTSISNTDENHELTEISNLSSNDTENTQTPHCDQDSVSEMETDSLLEISSSSKKKDYEIGDIVWAKIGRYPFWPSIVCPYPESQTYIRVKKFMLHVRFCNDKGRRSWARVIENYFGKDGLISKYPNCLSSIKNSKNLFNTWNLAVEEADRLSKLDRETRLREFYNIYLSSDDNLDSLNLSLNNSFEGVSNSASKVRTYSRKRSLTVPEQDNAFKIIKSINMSVNGSTSSKSIDIPVLSKSDDADSTVSDISMNYAFIEDNEGSKMKKIIKKRRSTKTYPPKSSFTDKYNVSDLMETSPEYNDDNILSINHEELTDTPMTSTSRMVSVQRKLEVSTLEGDCDQEDLSYSNSRRSSKKIIPKSSSSSKKSLSKKPQLRKSTVKSESSPEPDTTESETSSKNETHSSIFLASSKDKQLFIKNFKRACVVCKNIEDTVKCMGSCQSYFHVECLAKSEERYHKNVPKINIKNKKTRSKKRNSKSSLKNKESVPQIIDNIDEADTNKLYEKDDSVVSKSLNGFKTLPKEEYLDHCNAESKVQDQSKSDDNLNEEHKSPNIPESNDLPTNGNCNTMKDENLQDNKKLLNVDKDSMKEKCIENTVETPIKPINSSTISEKMSKDSLKYLCSLCKMEKTNCSDCGLDIEDPGQKIVCKISNCGKYYHEKCLRDWPQCQWLQGLRNNVRCVICPHHVCHLCISDNPKISCTTHCPPEKLTRCIKCPTAYHRSEYCLPAGSQVLTYSDIICSRHFEPTNLQIYHHNANWCFICTLVGGPLVFCDLCPSSFHIECLNQNPSEFENGFICEECQTGRYPLYGEIVWVKIGNYRWWPAQIVFPNQVPCSLNAVPHSAGQFAVLFFGTHDYYWVNRGRVFSFQEGDDENVLRKNKMKGLDQTFQDAIIEAAQAHNAYVLDKLKNDAIVSKKYLTKPPKFVRIKFNKPYGNVKNMELAANTMTPCECDPTNPNPCGPGSDCLNRMLMFECQPQLCPAGDKCNNQRFTKTLYPPMVPFLTPTRGWGLKTLEDIKEGSFVIEYVGDVIDEEEYQRRCLEMHQRNEQNYYFLTIDNSRMIDAGPKGNLSRFMNHSCEPNCVTQKWTVNGDTRIGLFALHDIPRGSELVFDYRLQSCSGVEKKPCQCGATRCSKFIGVKVEEEKKKIIPVNDVEKCKGTSKNKRKPLKLKDNVSDSEKSKLSKVSKNDQNISTIENGGIETEDDKIDDSKKLKAKTSIRKSSTVLKNENSKSTETQVSVRKRFRNSTRINTNMTKDSDNNANPLESEQTKTESKRKLKKTLSRFSSIKDDTSDTDDSVMMKRKRQGKHLKKKNVIKTDLFTKPKHSTDLSKATALCSPEERGRVVAAGLKTPANMKTRISKRFTQDLTKTEQIHDVLENANAIKPNKPTVTQEKSRHSLTRLAKSRHSVLSKNNNNNEEKKEQIIVSKRKFDKEKKKTAKISNAKKKRVEISSVKTIIAKKNKINKQSLMSKIYHQNDSCLICGKGHTELACKNKKCPRVFHLSCMNKTRIVKSGFICPSHFCFVCKKRKVVAKCKFCVKSFCTAHVKGNIFKDPLGNGMLCTTHHPNKKPMPLASALSTHHSLYNVCNKFNTADKNIEKPVDLASPNLVTAMPTEAVLDTVDDDELDLDVDDMTEEEYSLTRVVKDDCDREYIHIGGFNVCNMSDLVTDQIAEQTRPIDTDGDLFKPSSASVVIDIESASALYQPAEALELVSIATENKDNLDYANIQFIPDASQNKNKWLAAGP